MIRRSTRLGINATAAFPCQSDLSKDKLGKEGISIGWWGTKGGRWWCRCKMEGFGFERMIGYQWIAEKVICQVG